MKKTLALILCGALMLSIARCGTTAEPAVNSGIDTQATTETTTADPNTTSKGTTTADPTTTTAANGDGIKWVGGSTTVKAGETAKISFTIADEKKVALPVAGAQFTVKCDFNGTAGTDANAYEAKVIANPATSEFAFANAKGAQVASADGKTVIEITYTVPADAKGGDYKVDIDNLKVFDTNGKDISALVEGVDVAV